MLTSLDANGWPGMATMPRQDRTGPSWPDSYTGGASALLVYRQGANRGLQGLRFAGPIPGACRCAASLRLSKSAPGGFVHLPAVIRSKGEQGNPEKTGQWQRLLPHFPYAQKITASDRYYPHLIAS